MDCGVARLAHLFSSISRGSLDQVWNIRLHRPKGSVVCRQWGFWLLPLKQLLCRLLRFNLLQ